MVRVLLLVVFGGCFTKPERPFHDEDRDGIADNLDPCPHLAKPQSDQDDDGIGDDCDLDANVGGETRHFYSFESELGELDASGGYVLDADALVIGALDSTLHTFYVQGPAANAARIQLAFDLETYKTDATFTELGARTVDRGPLITERGDLCFIGHSMSMPTTTSYIEIAENDRSIEQMALTSEYTTLSAELDVTRRDDRLTCSATTASGGAADSFVPLVTPGTAGRTGISLNNVTVRLHYLWVVTR